MNNRYLRLFIIVIITGFIHSSLDANALFAQEQNASSVEKLDFANGLFTRGMYNLALDEYQKFIDTHKKSELADEAYLGKAESLFFLDEYDRARQTYLQFLKHYPQDEKRDLARMRLGQILSEDKSFEEAATHLEKVRIEQIPEKLRQSYHFHYGRSLFEIGRMDEAIKNFEEAIALEDSSALRSQSYLSLGDVYAKQDKITAAFEAYEKAEEFAQNKEITAWVQFKKGALRFLNKDYDQTVALFQAFLKQYPDHHLSAQAAVNLMSAYFNKGDFQSVRTTFISNFDKEAMPQQPFQALYILTNALLRQRDMVEALATVNRIIEKKDLTDEQKARAFSKKAEILIKMKEYGKALNIIQNRLAAVTKENDEILFFEAESYYGLDQYHGALSTYEKIINDFPQSSFYEEAVWGKALSLKALGESQKALALLNDFVQTATQEALVENARYNMILIHAQMDNEKQAIKSANAYLQQYPLGNHYEKVLYLLGGLYTQNQQYDKAIETYQRYIEDFSDTARIAEVRFLLGYNQQMAGRPQQAVETYQSIEAVGKENKYYYSAQKNTAGIFIEEGKLQQAFIYLKKILEEFEDNDLTPATFIWVAQQFIREERYKEALNVLNEVPLKKTSAKEKAAIAYFKAEALYGTNEPQKAIEHYDAAISAPEADTYSRAAQVGRAQSLAALKRYDQAGNELETLVENNPQDQAVSIHARYQLGQIEEAQGNMEAAIKYYLLVAVLYDDPKFVPQALFKAGGLLEKQKKLQEAIRTYEELINRFEKNELAKKANERIEILKKK